MVCIIPPPPLGVVRIGRERIPERVWTMEGMERKRGKVGPGGRAVGKVGCDKWG